MTFLAYVVFIFNVSVIGILVWWFKGSGMKVKFIRLREWKGVHKFGTLPLIAFIVLMFVGLSAMNADTQNKIDKMYADAGKTRPSVVQSETPQATVASKTPKVQSAGCQPMILGEDRNAAKANVVCYNGKGERSRPTWEEWDKIK